MNDWAVPKLEWDDAYRPNRGKVLTAEELEAATGPLPPLPGRRRGRRCPRRTLPGVHPNGAFLTRGSGHDRYGNYTEDSEPYADVLARDRAEDRGHGTCTCPRPEIRLQEGCDDRARDGGRVPGGGAGGGGGTGRAREVEVDFLRVRAFPFHPDVEAFLMDHA